MTAIKLDPARKIPIYYRIGEAASFDFVFTSSNQPYDIRAFDWELFLKKATDKANADKLLHLTIGDGLEITGADFNRLRVTITPGKGADLNPTDYFWRARNITQNKTWLNGIFHAYNGEFDAGSESEDIAIDVSVGDVVVNVALTLSELSVSSLSADQLQELASALDAYTRIFDETFDQTFN